MLKYYYILWVDTVVYLRNKEKDDRTIFLPIIQIASALFLNIGTILFTLLLFDVKFELKKNLYQIFSFIGIYNQKMMMAIIFLMFCFFHYLMIFRENKIERLIEEYPYRQGKVYKKYVIISVLLFFLPLFLLYLKG